jgi:hypothetical protein
VTLLARENTPKAIGFLVALLDEKGGGEIPEAAVRLRELMEHGERHQDQVRAAAALLHVQRAAADSLLSIARLLDAKLEVDPKGRSMPQAPGVTVVIQRQGREVLITDERTSQRLKVSDEDEVTVEGHSVGERLDIHD